MRIFKTFLILITVGLYFSPLACTSKKSSSPSKPAYTSKTVRVGSTKSIIARATLNSKIDFNFFKDVSKLNYKATHSFVEFKTVATDAESKVDVLKENAPAEYKKNDEEEKLDYDVHLTQDDEGYTLAVLKGKDRTYVLSNRLENGKRVISYEMDSGSTGEMDLLHFSTSEDGQHMSLLVSEQTSQDGLVLVAMYFSKQLRSDEPIRIGQYNYIVGMGIKTNWPKENPVTLSICGYASTVLTAYAKEAAELWNEALENKLVLKLEVQKSFPPFSDLRHRGIYWIDTYIIDPLPTPAFGAVYSVYISSHFIDGDIMIFAKELQKDTDYVWAYKVQRTLTHEIGHFLGLHHQFDGTQSIMSYDFSDDATITSHDKTAIQELYKD